MQGRILQYPDLDLERSLRWLQKGWVSRRVVSNVLAVQEGMLVTKEFRRRFYKDADGTCRLKCGAPGRSPLETIQHVVSCCPHFRSGLMLERHNAVCNWVYYALCEIHEIKVPSRVRRPDPVVENHRVILYSDHKISTDRPIMHCQPDIVVVDKVRKAIAIIEVRVSWPSAIAQEERRKYLKYAVNSNLEETADISQPFPAGDNLLNEMQRLYSGYSARVIPLVVGVCGEISVNTHASLLSIGIPPSRVERLIDGIARSAAMGTHRVVLAHMGNPTDNH